MYEDQLAEMRTAIVNSGWHRLLKERVIMKKRVSLNQLRKHDSDHDDSIMRELEMLVEGNLIITGYSIQFWQDVRLYGVDEAILYIRNGPYGDANAIDAGWQRIKTRLKS